MMKGKNDSELMDDLYLFYDTIIASKYKNTCYCPHIDEISCYLTDIALNNTDYKHLCISLAPRHSKSSLITLAYPLWLIFNNPSLKILIVNSSSGLSEKFGIQLREAIKEYGHHFNVFLSDIKHSSSYIMFCDANNNLYTGSIRLVGAGGTITGTDADYLIIDDPYKGFDDIVPSQLEKTIEWFKTIILQRLEPESRLIVLHTRWHTNDLQGYLKEHNTDNYYKFLTFPAILDDGTPLWKERYSIEYLRKKEKDMGEKLFQSIFQQKPLDNNSNFFNLDLIDFEPEYDVDDIVFSVRAWDIASSESRHADYTAGVLMHKLKDETYLITDLVYGQFGGNNLRIIQDTARQDGANTRILIETGVASAGELLYREWRQQLKGYRLEQAKPIHSKVDRATPLQNAVLNGKLKIDINDDELRGKIIGEFKAFPDGIHDDIIDACSHAFNYLKKRSVKAHKVPLYMNL